MYIRDITAEQKNEIITAAAAFVWDCETWEHYQEMKGSNSAALPPEFMRLCESIEDAFGPMPITDNGN